MARFQITHAQYRTFLTAKDGHGEYYVELETNIREEVNASNQSVPIPVWWDGLSAEPADRSEVNDYVKPLARPRGMVSWYDVMAFCRWLSHKFGAGIHLSDIRSWAVRLPTEYEWEKVARNGKEGYIYPWGSVEYINGYANVDEGKSGDCLGDTAAVGVYPHAASSEGIFDLCGNVQEWTLSHLQDSQVYPSEEDLKKHVYRVTRGGSYIHNPFESRTTYRDGAEPNSRYEALGFRVVTSIDPATWDPHHRR